MKQLLLFILFFNYSAFTFAQTELKIAEDVVDYQVDRIGNVYYYDAKNILTKYETNIHRYTKFADLKNGKISSIDVSNPLRVLVFYADQGVVKFLDVNLTEINSLQIRNTYPDGWVSAVASSNNNGLWMYDNLNRRLLKLDEQLNIVFQSGDLYLVLSKKINPSTIVEYHDELFMVDKKNGIFVFDLFGGYKKTIPIFVDDVLQIETNKIYYQKGTNWLLYQSLKTDTLSTNLKEFEKPYLFSNQIYFFLKNKQLILQTKE
jgi:hypothetical protein